LYCPQCRIEYRDGFTECSDCRVPLVADLPAELKGPGDPDLTLVTVLEGNSRVELASAKGLLEQAGIPFYVLGEEISARYAIVSPFIHPWWRVQVALDREAEARTLLRQLEETDPAREAGEEENPESPR
jgi:hypothetical protein